MGNVRNSCVGTQGTVSAVAFGLSAPKNMTRKPDFDVSAMAYAYA
jgi:hypothetical protein